MNFCSAILKNNIFRVLQYLFLYCFSTFKYAEYPNKNEKIFELIFKCNEKGQEILLYRT